MPPPSSSRSRMTTRATPFLRTATAAASPAGPAPTIATSTDERSVIDQARGRIDMRWQIRRQREAQLRQGALSSADLQLRQLVLCVRSRDDPETQKVPGLPWRRQYPPRDSSSRLGAYVADSDG